MNQEEAKKELEKMGYIVEEQPRYQITVEEDEEFLLQVEDLVTFLKKVKE